MEDLVKLIDTLDSEHEGTVINLKETAGIVSLPYGVEAYCPAKHMKKEDGSNLGNNDKTNFRIIEFNKDAKKIIISHSQVWSETVAANKKAKSTKVKKDMKKINSSVEKSTFGDLDALSELKAKMEKEKK